MENHHAPICLSSFAHRQTQWAFVLIESYGQSITGIFPHIHHISSYLIIHLTTRSWCFPLNATAADCITSVLRHPPCYQLVWGLKEDSQGLRSNKKPSSYQPVGLIQCTPTKNGEGWHQNQFHVNIGMVEYRQAGKPAIFGYRLVNDYITMV